MRHLLSMIGLLVLLAVVWACEADQSVPADEPPASVQKARKRVLEQRKAQALERTRRQKAVDEAWAERKSQPTPRAIERGLLWRVEPAAKQGEAKPSGGPVYLFGTVHGGVDADQWEELPPEVRQAMEQTTMVALEADLRPFSAEQIREHLMLPEGEALSDDLGEERVAKLSELMGQPPRAVDRMRPWVASSGVTASFAGDDRAVDYWIRIHAQVLDQELVYLETTEEQIAAVEGSISAASLADMLDRLDEARDLYDEMVAAYKVGDAEKLAEVAFNEKLLAGHPKMYERLFVARNRAWVPKIESYLERGDVFVAVGAGHLVGDDSVVRMLEERGHAVSRVPPVEDAP